MERQKLVEVNLPQLRELRLLVYMLPETIAMIFYSPYHNYTGSLSTEIPPDAAMSLAKSGKTYCLSKT